MPFVCDIACIFAFVRFQKECDEVNLFHTAYNVVTNCDAFVVLDPIRFNSRFSTLKHDIFIYKRIPQSVRLLCRRVHLPTYEFHDVFDCWLLLPTSQMTFTASNHNKILLFICSILWKLKDECPKYQIKRFFLDVYRMETVSLCY